MATMDGTSAPLGIMSSPRSASGTPPGKVKRMAADLEQTATSASFASPIAPSDGVERTVTLKVPAQLSTPAPVQLKAGASFTSPVFSPGDSPASLAAPPQSQSQPPQPQAEPQSQQPHTPADDGGVSAEAFEAVRAQLAQQTERIEQVVDEVTRLESEKGQWMELYAQSEIEFATMVARSSGEAAREVALDCEAYAARVQVNWITAAGRRRDKNAVLQAFGAWHALSARSSALEGLLAKGQRKADESRLRDAMAIWMAVSFCEALREQPAAWGASPLSTHAKALTEVFDDAASPAAALSAKASPVVWLDSLATDASKLREAEDAGSATAVAAGLVEELPADSTGSSSDESSDEVDADERSEAVEAAGEAQMHRPQRAGVATTLDGLYDQLAVVSSALDACDAEITDEDLAGQETDLATQSLVPARPAAPLSDFLVGATASPERLAGPVVSTPLDFGQGAPAPVHAVHAEPMPMTESETDSDEGSSDWSSEGDDEAAEESVTIDLQNLVASYQQQAYGLGEGGLLSALEQAAIVQMDNAAVEHYVDGLLRRCVLTAAFSFEPSNSNTKGFTTVACAGRCTRGSSSPSGGLVRAVTSCTRATARWRWPATLPIALCCRTRPPRRRATAMTRRTAASLSLRTACPSRTLTSGPSTLRARP